MFHNQNFNHLGEMMKNIKPFGLTALINCLLFLTACSGPVTSGPNTADVTPSLLPNEVIERIAERSEPRLSQGVTAPSFIVDPSWPKTLPNNWRVGQIGGITVDQHDNIWVYHRPRSLSSSASAGLGVAGTNEDGEPVDGLGNPRPFADQASG